MKPNVSALERAFELAATGHFSTVSEIKLKLLREGYQYEQVEGPDAFETTRGGHREGAQWPASQRKGAAHN